MLSRKMVQETAFWGVLKRVARSVEAFGTARSSLTLSCNSIRGSCGRRIKC